ncbi:uncharacterized protein LOC128986021 [Macrosteles quadrilineatus]|uniref:uncharacterized protein LOC128986021 n=1 Tax=Macrosteles quadrilineatus TaxID=74068 RepID=UPI0023E1BF3D|nr:uncharacterized protein LOC128986021 [Macrosteles quadrilineatus]
MSNNPRNHSVFDIEAGKKFTKAGFMKTWEAFPLAITLSSAMFGMAAFIAWQCNTRDIQVNRRRKPINERVDLLNPRTLKLRIVEHGPEPVPELHSIYRQMEEERRRRMEEMEAMRRRQAKRKAN